MAQSTEVVLRLTGDASGLQSAIKAADKQLGQLVRQTDRAEAALGGGLGRQAQVAANGIKQVGMASSAASKRVNQFTAEQALAQRSARATRANMQNLGFQLQDVAVQYEMGTNAARIFAQQGSQIAGIFGPQGAAIGAVLAIVAALAPALFNGSQALEDMGKALEDTAEKVDELEEAYDNLFLKIGESGGGFDAVTEDVQKLFAAQAELAEATAKLSFESFVETADDAVGNATKLISEIERLSELAEGLTLGMAMADTQAEASILNSRLQATGNILDGMSDRFAQMAEKAGMTSEAYADFVTVWQNFDSSGSLEGQIALVQQMLDSLTKAGPASEELTGAYIQQRKALTDLLALLLKRNDVEGKADREREETLSRIRGIMGEIEGERIKATMELTKQEQLVSAMAQNYVPLLAAQREFSESTQTVVDEFEDAMKAAERLKDELGDAAFEALRLAGVDMESGVDAAAKAAARLAADLNISLAAAMAMAKIASDEDAVMGQTVVSGKTTDRYDADTLLGMGYTKEYLLAIGKIKPPRSGGGGANRKEIDAQKELEASIKATGEAIREATAEANKFNDVMYEGLERIGNEALDGLIDGLITGELAFKDFARNVVNDLTKVIAKMIIMNTLSSAFGGTSIGDIFGFANGGVVSGDNVVPFAKGGTVTPFARGGVVGSPTVFPMSSGVGLMGEAGPEAIMPLQRTSSGDLGVAGPAVTINNYTGQEVSVDRTEEMITIAVGRSVKAAENNFVRQMATGQGAMPRALESGYNSRRKAT